LQDNADIPGLLDAPKGGKNEPRHACGLTEVEIEGLRLSIPTTMDQAYAKWTEEDVSLSGILTNKATKQRN